MKSKKTTKKVGREPQHGAHARVPCTQIYRDIAALVNRVAFGHERIVIQRRNTDVAALVSMNDLAILGQVAGHPKGSSVAEIKTGLRGKAGA